MIAHLHGTIADIQKGKATIATASGVSYDVLLPPYLDGQIGRVGATVQLSTVHVLESPNQGATFLPRLFGFATAADREVYEAMTQIRGLGHRKALRALAEPPTQVAAMIARGDEVGLKRLPEIGAKLAKTLVEELGQAFRDKLAIEEMESSVEVKAAPSDPQAEDAVRALIALGEQPAEASRKVTLARQKRNAKDVEASELVSLALSL
ncbi:MAG: Holliday junction branch migration protein RuvA [Phycisphaerales bacterium]|jgi:Holliday junction resolvasome RuvABC DNA-binding subunit